MLVVIEVLFVVTDVFFATEVLLVVTEVLLVVTEVLFVVTEVLFVERLYPVSIQIYETYNPGAIVRIMGCDYQGGTSVDTGRRRYW